MTTTSIRMATLQDADNIKSDIVIMAMETENKQLDDNIVQSSIQAILAQPNYGFYLVATDENKQLGSLLVTTEHSIRNPYQVWWFESVYVRQESRLKGVFRQLFNKVEEQAKIAKVPLKLYVELENKNAQLVYEKLGMYRTTEVVYEDDFLFHPVDIINTGEQCKSTTIVDSSHIVKLISDGFSLMRQQQLDTTENQISKSINNNSNPFIICENTQSEYLLGCYFIEYSDWRFGLNVWFYDIITNCNDNIRQVELIHSLIDFVKSGKSNIQPEVKCIRFIFEGNNDQFKQTIQQVGLKESHYYIYCKQQWDILQ